MGIKKDECRRKCQLVFTDVVLIEATPPVIDVQIIRAQPVGN